MNQLKIIFTVALTVVTLILAYLAWSTGRVPWPIVVIFALVTVALIIWVLQGAAGALMFADPDVTISKNPLRIGESFDVKYEQSFKQKAEVRSICIKLVMREWARHYQGSRMFEESHEHIVQEIKHPARVYNPGESFREETTFRIPPDAMHTFDSGSHNRLGWYVVAAIDVVGRPDFNGDYEVNVLSERMED
jgi:hypothetical protein